MVVSNETTVYIHISNATRACPVPSFYDIQYVYIMVHNWPFWCHLEYVNKPNLHIFQRDLNQRYIYNDMRSC